MIYGIRTPRDLIMTAALTVGSFFIGLVIEKFVRPVLSRIAERAKWEGNTLLIGAFHGMAYWWFGTAGVYTALSGLSIPLRGQSSA